MKYAFTMIELIFVIVILGILAAVAIPKLSATRNDALIARMSQNISVAVSEIASFGVANGQTTSDLSLMSNAISGLVVRNEATLDVPNNAVDISMGTIPNCIRMEVVKLGTDENLTISLGATGDGMGDALHTLFDSAVFPMAIRGALIEY
ncbi:MAG: hypothetical protein COA44_05785 [Arcobacter sp.]|nr:MAG: hypothetical protein COA44_05785 [Arcobacter sp.]